ncbi:hypothetical protein GCM10018954_100720 [Kutzneria kofuensis]
MVQTVTSARKIAFEFSRSTSHDTATDCVMVPDADNTWLPNHHRNSDLAKEPNILVNAGKATPSPSPVN